MKCVDEWRKTTTNAMNVTRCEACHGDFRWDGGYDNIGPVSGESARACRYDSS